MTVETIIIGFSTDDADRRIVSATEGPDTMDDDFNAAVEEFQARMAEIADLQAERALLAGVATTARRRVRVTVNADGIATDIKFSGAIGELTPAELADAVTAASRAAVLEVARKAKELMAPLDIDQAEAPEPDDLFATINSLRDHLG
ncbi:YbaB/EbfC family nucleoid-associated protein [Nocardia sp. NPDC051900]|uniref:YbaB/EbfC family nucleoid-associated protein n=1 Tax=Nocardia sp. NPDC051900 TaxID=3364326 RepID=UPI003793040C